MIHISGVLSHEVNKIWDKCSKYLELGNDQSQEELSLDDIRELCVEREMQLWVIFDDKDKIYGAGTTQIIEYPNKTVCRIVTLGGIKFKKWKHTLTTIEEWARQSGCEAVEMFCRKGFKRELRDYEYKEIYTVLGKKLTPYH